MKNPWFSYVFLGKTWKNHVFPGDFPEVLQIPEVDDSGGAQLRRVDALEAGRAREASIAPRLSDRLPPKGAAAEAGNRVHSPATG